MLEGACVLVGAELVVVGAAVLVGDALVVGCTVEVLGGAELLLWAIVLAATGGCKVGVGAAEEVSGITVVMSQSVVVGAPVDSAMVVVGVWLVTGTTVVTAVTAGAHNVRGLKSGMLGSIGCEGTEDRCNPGIIQSSASSSEPMRCWPVVLGCHIRCSPTA